MSKKTCAKNMLTEDPNENNYMNPIKKCRKLLKMEADKPENQELFKRPILGSYITPFTKLVDPEDQST